MKIHRTLHSRLGIRILPSRAESISHKFASLTRERYFQHSKIKFVSLRDHVISFIYLTRWLTGSHCSCFRKGLIWSYLLVRVITQHSGHFVGDLSEIWIVHTITNWHQTNSEKRYGFLGTLLTSIGIPLLLNLFTRIGLQNRPSRSRGSPKGLQNRQYNMKVPYWPPPFIGSWGNTKEFFWEKQAIQWSPYFGGNSLNKTTFSNEPTVSDLDLLNRCSYFNIQITGVNSTNQHMPKLHSPRVINLDKVKGSGIHWTCWVPFYFDKNTLCYFDSWNALSWWIWKKSTRDNLFNVLFSVLSLYYRIYFLYKWSQQINIYDILKDFSQTDFNYNEIHNQLFWKHKIVFIYVQHNGNERDDKFWAR